MSLPFDYFNVSPTTLHPHGPCSHCSSPYHSIGDCPHWGQFSEFSNEQLNTSFSSPGFESNSNFYNPDWSNNSDFSWHDYATGNFAPQVDKLHHPEYPQFDNHFSSHSYDYPPQTSSLEDTLKEFMEQLGQPTISASHEPSLEESLETFRKTINQPCQELIDATVANTEAIARLEGQFGQLVSKINLVEEEEFQIHEMAHPSQESFEQHFPTAHVDDFEGRANQLMAARQAHTQFFHTHTHHQSCEYCYHPSHQFDDCPFIYHYMTEVDKYALHNAQTTTILVDKEIGDEIASECSLEDLEMEHLTPDSDDLDLDRRLDHVDTFSEPSLENPSGECFDEIENDLDKFLEQADRFSEPSLEDPLEESFAQFEFELDLDMIHEQAISDPTPEVLIENGGEEKKEQFEPPPISNWPNDKEVSTEAYSFVTIPLETYHVPSFQCLEEPSYVEIFEESHTKDHKSRNRVPMWIPRNKDNYIRWLNIRPEGYQILRKKGWKGLIGHPYERGRCGIFLFFIFRTAFLFLLFYFHVYICFCFSF
jgi:Zn-finger protein